MSLLFKYLKPQYPRIFLGFVFRFFATIIDLSIPLILAYILDSVVPLGKIEGIFLWGGVMLLISVSSLKINILSNKIASETASNAVEEIRYDLFSKTISLSNSQIDKFSLPSLVTRLTSDTYNLFNMIARMQKMGSRAPTQFFGGLIIMMSMDLTLSLIFIAMLPPMFYLSLKITRIGIPLHRESQVSSDILVRSLRENIQGLKIIKIFGGIDQEIKKFSNICKIIFNTEKKAVSATALISPIMNFLINFALILVIIAGAWKINAGTLTPGVIIAFITYFTMMLHTIMAVSRMFSVYSRGSASFSRIAEILELENEEVYQIQSDNKSEEKSNNENHISFNNVSFAYPNSKQMALRNISFKINKGETLGIIGETGSGKSTLINLLLKQYPLTEGEILLNNQNINTIPNDVFFKKFGTVLQNETIFAETIKDNITFGRDVTNDELMQIAETVQAKDFIFETKERFDHLIKPRGQNLSGGQKQRLGIARALAGKPEVLVLDDAFSALDYTTDYLLRKNLEKDYKDTTTIIVSQKMSSIVHADNIIILKNGEIEAQGTHKELLKISESYREIIFLQIGELEENDQ